MNNLPNSGDLELSPNSALIGFERISLKPKDVRRVYRQRGKTGVREMFLDLIIREDLKEGPMEIPEEERAQSNR